VVVDGQRGGKDKGSDGIRLSAFSQLMADLGCKVAYNLDGGDSAQMYWNGAIINKSNNESRVISDIIYILPEP
jgi:exopolysaccharide biosynthesis protein